MVPAGPLDGFSDIFATGGGGGVVTVNDAEAEFADASVALTVGVPAAEDDGTVMEPVKPPVESVVMTLGFVGIAEPSYDIVMPEFAAKFLPVTVTVVPVVPLVGLRDSAVVL